MTLQGCGSNDIAYQLGYNRTYVAVFTSCTDPNAPYWNVNPTYVANSNLGYYIEYEKTFQSQTAPGGRARYNGSAAIANPYSTVLRPVTSLRPLLESESVWFDGAIYTAIDAMKSGSAYQNASNNTAIINSISSATYGAVSASRFQLGSIQLGGVNFFRPGIFYNNGGVIIDTSETEVKVNGANNQGDLSVGPDLPFCVTGGYELNGKLDNLYVYGGAAQNVYQITGSGDSSAPYVSFPIKCTLWFRLKGNA
jgi:hypothetical protein